MDQFEINTMRGEEATRILHSELFAAAFNDTKTGILNAWAALPSAKDERAQDLHRMLGCLDRVKRCLEEHITTGHLAQIEINGREKRSFSLSGVKNAFTKR